MYIRVILNVNGKNKLQLLTEAYLYLRHWVKVGKTQMKLKGKNLLEMLTDAYLFLRGRTGCFIMQIAYILRRYMVVVVFRNVMTFGYAGKPLCGLPFASLQS